jgi:hypothetical protein
MLAIATRDYAQDLTFESNTNIPLILKTNGINRFHINADGKIGVDTSTPLNFFHLSNGISGVTPNLRKTVGYFCFYQIKNYI